MYRKLERSFLCLTVLLPDYKITRTLHKQKPSSQNTSQTNTTSYRTHSEFLNTSQEVFFKCKILVTARFFHILSCKIYNKLTRRETSRKGFCKSFAK